VAELVRRNGVSDGYLRITVSRGPHMGALTKLEATAPTVFIDAHAMDLLPLDDPPPSVLARATARRNETSLLVRHKSLGYMENVLALAEGRARGADEVYFLNSRGRLAEGATTNIFFVRGAVVCTPDVRCGLLPGITREIVLSLCAEEGMEIEEAEYQEDALARAGEIFCTNSLRGVVPVRAVLELPAKCFGPRPVTARLQRLYADLVRGDSL